MTKTIKALIVDDEPKSREVLHSLLEEYCSEVQVTGKVAGIDEAAEAIGLQKPDVVFLDIEMPEGSGFRLLEKYTDPPFRVIFITSYDQYALRAIRVSAVDYLLKPVNIDELRGAVKKVSKTISGQHQAQLELLRRSYKGDFYKIALPTQEGLHFVNIHDIEYCEASSNYTYLHLKDKQQVLVSRTLKEFDELLSASGFFRIHQSYLINMREIKKYLKGSSSVVMSGGKELTVSVRRKDEFMEMLNRL